MNMVIITSGEFVGQHGHFVGHDTKWDNQGRLTHHVSVIIHGDEPRLVTLPPDAVKSTWEY